MFHPRNDLPLGARTRGAALARLAQVARDTALKPAPAGGAEGAAHLKALATVLAPCGAPVRAGSQRAARLRVAHTPDLFTGVSREADRNLWCLEAHLRGKR